MKRVLTLSTGEHGMWNRRFHSQYVKVGVYSSREQGGGERERASEESERKGRRERERERVKGGRSVVLHPLLSRESHHETPKHKELRAFDWNQGTFYPGAGARLGQQHHPACQYKYYTSSSTSWPACLFIKKQKRDIFGYPRSVIKMSDGKTIQAKSNHPEHMREVIKASVFFLCGNLTLNGLHQPHSQARAHTQIKLITICPFSFVLFTVLHFNSHQEHIKKKKEGGGCMWGV